MDLRPILSRLRKLIATRDPAEIEQAVEIALSLDDPALFDTLLEGVKFATQPHRGQNIGVIVPGEFFKGDTHPAQRFNDHALRLLLARIGDNHPRAKAIRDEITSLTLHTDEPYPYLPLDLGPLAAFKNLRRVEIRGVSTVAHLDVLGDLPNLQELSLRSGNLTRGFEGLDRSRSLQTLYLYGPVHQIGDLGEGPALLKLEIPWGSALTSLHGIENLKAIETVDLRGSHLVSSLDAFAKITTLKRVTLQQFNSPQLTSLAGLEANRGLEQLVVSAPITSLDALRGMTRLKSLTLEHCTNLTDISALSECTGLEQVNLSRTSITSLDGLENSDIKNVDLTFCSALSDVRGLRGSTQITSIAWSRMNALASLDGIENLRGLTSLEIDNPHKLTSIAAVRELRSLTLVRLINPFALPSLDGLQNARDLAEISLLRARVLTDISALGEHPALKRVQITDAPELTDVTALAKLDALEILDLSQDKAVTDVNALAALPHLKALGLGGTGVDRARLDPKLKKIATFAAVPDLAALAARGPIERHGPHVPEAVTKDLKKSYVRLKRLLLARDFSLVEQGVELAATLDEKGIFEGLLEGVTYNRTLRRSRASFPAPHVPGGMFVANEAFTVTGPGAPFRDRALFGLLARAPADCAPANALREAVTALELDGESGHSKSTPVSFGALTVFPNLAEITVASASAIEDFERVREIKSLVSLAFNYCGPEDLSPLQDHPSLTNLYVQHHWNSPRAPLKGLERVASLASLVISGGSQTGSAALRDLPSVVTCRLQQIRGLESLQLKNLPKLTLLDLASFDTLDTLELEGCGELMSLRLHYLQKLKSVRGLGALTRLKSLSLSSPMQLPFVAADTDGLSGLTELTINSATALADLSALAPMRALETVHITYCQTLADITALAALPNLKRLTLEGCTKVSDLATLEALPGLTQLNVRRTMIDKAKLSTRLKRLAR